MERPKGLEGVRFVGDKRDQVVYDLDGQNVCLSNCLQPDRNLEEIRNLIFFPDGHLRHSWDLGGAILL